MPQDLQSGIITDWATFRAAALAGGFLDVDEVTGDLLAPADTIISPDPARWGPHMEASIEQPGGKIVGPLIRFGYYGAKALADRIPLTTQEAQDIAEAQGYLQRGEKVPAALAARVKAATLPEARSNLLRGRGQGKPAQAVKRLRGGGQDRAGNTRPTIETQAQAKLLLPGLLVITTHRDDLRGSGLLRSTL